MATWTDIEKDYDRVSPQARCPVCGKDDWCVLSKDHRFTYCNRVSSQYSTNLGFRHVNTDEQKAEFESGFTRPTYVPVTTNFNVRAEFCYKVAKPAHMEALSEQLGLSRRALNLLRVGWWPSQNCWTFPLKIDRKVVVGLMRRYADGSKKLMAGSGIGLYLPLNFRRAPCRSLVTEGASDTGAAVDMGFNAVGRFNAAVGQEILKELLQYHVVTIVADNNKNGIGMYGAAALQHAIQPFTKDVRILTLPSTFSDLRDMKVKLGDGACLNLVLNLLRRLWQ